MALIEPIDLNQFDLEPEPATFGPLWAKYFAEADGLDSQDLIDAGATVIPALSSVATSIDTPLNLADQSLASELALPADPELPKAELNAAPFADSFNAIRKGIPDEAFKAIPQDLLPPPELGGFNQGTQPAPVQPPIAGRPPGTGFGNGAGPLPRGAIHPQVLIRNTTRPGATDFSIGDYFDLEIVGMPGGRVTVAGNQNGKLGAPVLMGELDDTGYLTLAGQFRDFERGEWYETWAVNGETATPVLHFFVN